MRITITCDGDHGLLGGETFQREYDDLIAVRHEATRLGWRRIEGGSWRGPCCR